MKIRLIMILLFTILELILCSGCVNSSGNGNNISVDDSVNCNETFVSQERVNDSPEGSHAEYMNLSQNFTLPDKTMELIKTLFPQIISETIQNPEYVSSDIVPGKIYLCYDNVMSVDGSRYDIEFDPETYDITYCGIVSAIKYKKAEKNVSFDGAKEIASDFLKVLVSNSSENYLEGYLNSSVYEYYTDAQRNDTACGIGLTYTRVIRGVRCFESSIQMEVDSITGNVVIFYEYWPDLANYEFSSSNPDYSLAYAKELSESTINEKYPAQIKSYEYKPFHGGSNEIEPLWYDDELPLKYEKGKPIDLVWVFYLKVNSNPGYKSENSWNVDEISAHSGEIYNLFYKDIKIFDGEKYGISL
ncbi:hypothetical protein J2128_001915 [Methanomicrobium sp. W14]|uniref:hypothetical protein n=1 Tax=Methanomicrobium sp. W14 TaxID=2817839 RepID=UPI001AE46F4A|nr:hypothetical protein [Methanomicrobium sp. W14]MBP2133949.1 hypothetical protein [Methanomicrobium sp. W14]